MPKLMLTGTGSTIVGSVTVMVDLSWKIKVIIDIAGDLS